MTGQQATYATGRRRPTEPAHVVVFGGEAPRTGKSLLAIELSVALLRLRYKVGVIDLDRQRRTLLRFFQHRAHTKLSNGYSDYQLGTPYLAHVYFRQSETAEAAETRELEGFTAAVQNIYEDCDFLIIDCDATDRYLNRLAHAAADTVVTPISEDEADVNVLARIDPISREIIGPSIYADMIWECRKIRTETRLPPLDWIVVRQSDDPESAPPPRPSADLATLAGRIGFRAEVGPWLPKRYRDYHQSGLALFDIKLDEDEPRAVHRAFESARDQVSTLLDAFKLPLRHAAA
ncbi:MAG: division plane positioning ATPase MipZ [Neomegalonema sp.]|nr:division plane positioning ATPase MipZ [Neomegalonema sp.]